MKWVCALLASLAMLALGPAALAAQTPVYQVTIIGTGGTTPFAIPKNVSGQVAILLQGGTETVQLEASYDGSTWFKVVAAGSNQLYVWTLTGDNQADSFEGLSAGVQYRFNCTSYTSSVTITVLPQ